MDRAEIYVLENDLLVGLGSLTPKVERDSLYQLPPWRAVAWARIACSMGVLPRAERDGMVREAQLVGGNGHLKPWGDRTAREKELVSGVPDEHRSARPAEGLTGRRVTMSYSTTTTPRRSTTMNHGNEHPAARYRDKVERCEAEARKGTGEGTCDTVLEDGVCPRSRHHLNWFVPEVGALTDDEYYGLMERREASVWGNE